jgi:hypothetical protein
MIGFYVSRMFMGGAGSGVVVRREITSYLINGFIINKLNK